MTYVNASKSAAWSEVCHYWCRKSRGPRAQSYRNSIKIRAGGTRSKRIRFCLRHYAVFMRMSPILSRIHMRLGADSAQSNRDRRIPCASLLAAQSATRQLGRNRGGFGRELHMRSIALWLSAVSEPFPRRCSVNPEKTSSGAIGWYLKPRRLQFPEEAGRTPRSAAAPTRQIDHE